MYKTVLVTSVLVVAGICTLFFSPGKTVSEIETADINSKKTPVSSSVLERSSPGSEKADQHYHNEKHHELLCHKHADNGFLKEIIARKGNREVEISDLPDSKFKKQMQKLAEQNSSAAKRALNHLMELDVPEQDFSELMVDSSGELIYACKGLAIEAAGAEAVDPQVEVSGAAVPISNPPVRHSKPGSANIIYLDFNGESISGTAWNSGTETWECKPYDKDGNPDTFNDSEQTHIINAWKKVSEDYAPFDVDVTTERPAVFTDRVCHVMITAGKDKNGVSLPHDGYGGIGYVNVFARGSWATNYLITFCQPYNGTSVSEVISHEVGHNMGLSHDGINSSTYYRGHGSGETSWAPIMGASYNRNVTQWSKGEYTGSTNQQDDLSILAGKMSYKADDHGNGTSSASELNNLDGAVFDAGLIERSSEKDFFKFSVNPGLITIRVDSWRSGVLDTNAGNMDVKLELKNASGSTVATHNPASDTDAVINFDAPARGDYYIVVSPSFVDGFNNATPTGYSVYGSLGQYFISGSFNAYSNSEPQIETAASASPASIQLGSSTSLSVSAFDPDNDPLSYSWSKVSGPGTVNFAAQNSAETAAEFSAVGNYTLKVTVFDGVYSVSSTTNVTVTSANIISEKGSFDIEQVDRSTWHKVSMTKNYQDPVIIFSPLTTDGSQPAHIRVKNVNGNSFEWQIEEWAYLDGYHLAEKVDYIVLEAGTYELPDGRKFIAGNVAASDTYTSKSFSSAFQNVPVVVTQLSSAQDATPGTVRLNNVKTTSFDLKLQSEEAKGKTHGDEIVSFIAVESGMYESAGLLEADTTGISVDHNWFNLQFNGTYQETPSFFASFQTTRGGDTADLRIQNLNNSQVDVKVHEEQSKDSEVKHTKENLGYILFDLK